MRKGLVAVIVIVVLAVAGGAWWHIQSSHGTAPAVNASADTQSNSVAKSDSFDKKQFSTTDPNSLWVIVNKQHPLTPVTYAPSDLRKPNVTLRVPGATEAQMRDAAATALEKMFADASATGYKLEISTAYRGYDYQKTLYDGYVNSQGQAAADQESARPGYSEHQTGLAVDLRNGSNTCGLEACFGTTPEGEWLAANSYKYGFILRYPQGKEQITGYEYEPWHFRYVGADLANEMHTTHTETLEEFFGVSGGATYK